MKIELLFLGGALDGRQLELEDRDLIRIGRHPDNDVAFDIQSDLAVSGRHAELRREADGYYLYDVGSSNGTFIGDAKVERARLASGQEITFGLDGPRLLIRFVDDASTVMAEGSAGQTTPDPTGRQVGAKTVAMMINVAMREAQSKKGRVGKSTVFMRAMVNQAVTKSTRRFKIVSLVLLVLLIGAVAGLLTLRYFERREASEIQDQIRRQMARLMEQQRSASSVEKQQLAQKLEQLNRRLATTNLSATGKEIVARNMKAVFLMAYSDPLKGSKGFCTAFAVRKRTLGTNAHCIIALEKYRGKGLEVFVVMNRNPSRRYRIVRVAHHPGYHKPRLTISKDVGAVEVDADVPVVVKLASAKELRQLESGDLMYMYGFPGRLANVASPNATLVQGVIGRVTRLDGRFGTFAENQLIQHSGFTSGGTSGSPIFSQKGLVIAVNTGGYVEPGSLQIMDPTTGKAGRLVVAKQLPGYNFGIRIDLLERLLADLGM
jgi:hypothetical protein